jgi:uncharacterized protein
MQAPDLPVLFLSATLAMLAVGPLVVAYAHTHPRLTRWVDRFVLVCIVALVALEVAPQVVQEGGYASLLFLLMGLFGPTLMERASRRLQRGTHIGTLVLALAGLILHTLADGAVLAAGSGWALSLAVVLHTLPVGMAVWWLLSPSFGRALPVAVLAIMAAGTLTGFHFGITLSEMLDAQTWAWFQALVAGAILHVVFGRPHLEGHERNSVSS